MSVRANGKAMASDVRRSHRGNSRQAICPLASWELAVPLRRYCLRGVASANGGSRTAVPASSRSRVMRLAAATAAARVA